MKRLIVMVILAAIAFSGQSQVYDTLGANNFAAGIGADGMLFQRPVGSLGDGYTIRQWGMSFFPRNNLSGQYTFFADNLWFWGFDKDLTPYISSTTYTESSGTHIAYGPVADVYDAAYDVEFKKLWHINRSELENHILNYNANGSLTSQAVVDWQAERSNAGSFRLFEDMNGDNLYDPQDGDIPKMYGDDLIYTISNTDRSTSHDVTVISTGLEIHTIAFSFAPKPGMEFLDNVIFVKYAIINKAGRDYHDVTLGKFTDFDVGCHDDDYIGTDSTRGLFYAYDGVAFNTCNANYDSAACAFGGMFLNQTLDLSVIYNNVGPPGFNDYRAYLQGDWTSGIPGVNNGDPFNLIFPDNPNNIGAGAWNERTENNIPSDRRMLAFTKGIDTFKHNECICLDMAYIIARDTTRKDSLNRNLLVVNDLYDLADDVRQFYLDSLQDCPICTGGDYFNNVTGIDPIIGQGENHFSIYPNPANSGLRISANNRAGERLDVKLVDISGKTILEVVNYTPDHLINISSLQAGLYLVQVERDGMMSGTKKLIITR